MFNCGPDNFNFWNDFIPVILKYFGELEIPIGFGVLSGHGRNEIFLPLGRNIEMNISSDDAQNLSGILLGRKKKQGEPPTIIGESDNKISEGDTDNITKC